MRAALLLVSLLSGISGATAKAAGSLPARGPRPAEPTAVPAGHRMTVHQWERRFLAHDRSASRLQGYDVAGTGPGGWPNGCKQAWQRPNAFWWFWSEHCVDAAIKMWEATGKTAYLERSLAYYEGAMASAVAVKDLTRAHALSVGCTDAYVAVRGGCTGSSYASRPDASTYKGWHGWGHGAGTASGDEYALYEGEAWVYAPHLLLEMKARGLDMDPTYRHRYGALLSFIKQHVWEKWYVRGTSPGAWFYRISTYMSVMWAHIAMNLYLLSDPDDPRYTQYRDVYWNLNKAPGIPIHVRTAGHDIYHASLRDTQWRPRPDGSAEFSEDWNAWTPHQTNYYGDRQVFFMIQCVRRDPACVWTSNDLQRLSKTFTHYIWKGPAGTNCHASRVDGVGCGGATSNPSGKATGAYHLGWSRLGRYDTPLGREIQRRLELYESKLNMGWPISRAASGALNARLLQRGRKCQ